MKPTAANSGERLRIRCKRRCPQAVPAIVMAMVFSVAASSRPASCRGRSGRRANRREFLVRRLWVSAFVMILAAFTTVAFGAEPAATRREKPKREPDVLVVSEVFANDRDSMLPQPGKPVFYILLGGRERTLGSSAAGERMPSWEEVAAQVEKTLARQGFVKAEIGGPIPSIVLVVVWGSANALTTEFDDVDAETGETTTVSIVLNQREIRRLLGLGQAQLNRISRFEADELAAAATEDRLYLVVGALDAQALRKKEKQLVWRTWMSIPSVRHSLPDSLGVMLASAAPWLGRDTEVPTFVSEVDRRRAVVEMGEPEVIEMEEPVEPSNKKANPKRPR